jgi:Plasmid pRiA4b ORF-3-like protein
MNEPAAPASVFQVRVVLRGVSPMVWRRVLLRSDTTIAQLHHVVQTVMGWDDEHLHSFRIHGKDYGIARLGGMTFADNPHAVRLAELRLRPGERFAYLYDFGAWWQHDIRFEQALPIDPARRYPVCIGGAHACPPENCGGPAGYLARLRARTSLAAFEDLGLVAEFVQRWLEDGDRGTLDDRDEVAAALERMERRLRLDPDRFDRRAVNAALQQSVAALPD